MNAARSDAAFHVVLATRGIALSKSRLGNAVTPAERADLNRTLLARTLHVIAGWLDDPRRCVVVSACAEALAMAHAAGCVALEEPGGAGGHNHAAAVGADHARLAGAAKVMMLPADLPDLSACALDAYVAHAGRADLVVAPDKDGTGTNSLIAHAVPDLQFFFGDGSLARYVRWGAARGWRVALHAAPELAFDIDMPADYASWRARAPQPARGRSGGDAVL